MEQEGLAHCDLSGPNVLLPELVGGTGVGLVDVEQMYGPELRRPPLLPGGSPGYAHKTAPEGLWAPDADRFAGAVLLAEMLGWCDARTRDAAWGENYFDPQEMQQETGRYRTLVEVLQERWGSGVAGLFERAWRSETLADCATFEEWLVRLPEVAPVAGTTSAVVSPEIAQTPQPDTTKVTVQTLMDLARQFEEQGQTAAALRTYRQAQTLALAGSGLAPELALIVRDLETKQRRAVEPALRPAAEPPLSLEQVGRKAVNSEDLARLFDDALTAYQRGEWARSRELLAEVVRQQPDYARGKQRARNLLAKAERQLAAPVLPRRRWWLWAAGIGVAMLGLAIFLAVLAGPTVIGGQPTPTQATQTPTGTPSATPPPTSTPTPQPTPTVPPTPTPRPTATPTPTQRPVTSTPRSAHSAPALVGPENGKVFTGSDAQITLSWQPVGPLKSNEYYVIHVVFRARHRR